jgi:AMP-binding enzyme
MESTAANFSRLHTAGVVQAATEMGYSPTADPPRGEICIRGPMVFKGYFKMEDKTKESFGAPRWPHVLSKAPPFLAWRSPARTALGWIAPVPCANANTHCMQSFGCDCVQTATASSTPATSAS